MAPSLVTFCIETDFWKNIVAMEGRGEGGGEKQSTRGGQGSVAGNRGEAAVQNCRGYYYYYSVKPAFVAQRDVRSWHAPGKFEKMVK